jgi:hypothetical protein
LRETERIEREINALKQENAKLREEVDAGPKAAVGVIPPPGDGQEIYKQDPFLEPYRDHLEYRLVHLYSNLPLHQSTGYLEYRSVFKLVLFFSNLWLHQSTGYLEYRSVFI